MGHFFFFIVGTILGSFLNVCIHRLPRGESLLFPASHCPYCGQRLKWRDLVPLLSYIILRGSCRHCQKLISRRYPLLELVMGLLLPTLYFALPPVDFFPATAVTALVLVATCTDLKEGIIPDAVVLPALGMGILYSALFPPNTLWESVAGALLGGGVLTTIALLSRGGMGGGDIKLMAALGAWLGLGRVPLILFLSFLGGGMGALGLLFLGIKGRRDTVAFAPYIAAAVIVSLFWERQLLAWYFRLWY